MIHQYPIDMVCSSPYFSGEHYTVSPLWCTAYHYPLSSASMVRQSLNMNLWCETHPVPRRCVSHHTQAVCHWSSLVLVYSLPLLAILNYGASVTEQTPLVRDSPSAETSGFGVQLTVTLNYGVSVTEHKPFGARLTKHRDLWFWCTAYRYPLSSTMVRQSLNISLLVRDSPSAETSDLVYSLPLPAILDYV